MAGALARPAGVEPATRGSEVRSSIQLSYGRSSFTILVRLAGLEPAAYGLGIHRSIRLSYKRARQPALGFTATSTFWGG